MRLMVYLAALHEEPADFGSDVDEYNRAFEATELVLDELGGDPDKAIEIVVDEGYTYLQSSEALEEAFQAANRKKLNNQQT